LTSKGRRRDSRAISASTSCTRFATAQLRYHLRSAGHGRPGTCGDLCQRLGVGGL
jgi:hypothetical protein